MPVLQQPIVLEVAFRFSQFMFENTDHAPSRAVLLGCALLGIRFRRVDAVASDVSRGDGWEGIVLAGSNEGLGSFYWRVRQNSVAEVQDVSLAA